MEAVTPHEAPCSKWFLTWMPYGYASTYSLFFFLQFPSAKRELECRALQVEDENVKSLKKAPMLLEGHKNVVVYWFWFLWYTQGIWLSFSPCTLFCKFCSLAEAVASGTLPGKHNSFDFSGTLPKLSLLRDEMWLHRLPLVSLEPQSWPISSLPK